MTLIHLEIDIEMIERKMNKDVVREVENVDLLRLGKTEGRILQTDLLLWGLYNLPASNDETTRFLE
jgi:hypothetical protein